MADTSSKMDTDEKTSEKAVVEAVVVEVRGANVIRAASSLVHRWRLRSLLAQDDSKPDLYDHPLAPEHVLLRAPAVPPRTKA